MAWYVGLRAVSTLSQSLVWGWVYVVLFVRWLENIHWSKNMFLCKLLLTSVTALGSPSDREGTRFL